MKKAIFALAGSAMLLGVGVTAVADEPMAAHEQMMRSMDTNGDGKISKEEYMAYYEKMWRSMKKDSSGMVDAKSMIMRHQDSMMKDKGVSKDDANH